MQIRLNISISKITKLTVKKPLIVQLRSMTGCTAYSMPTENISIWKQIHLIFVYCTRVQRRLTLLSGMTRTQKLRIVEFFEFASWVGILNSVIKPCRPTSRPRIPVAANFCDRSGKTSYISRRRRGIRLPLLFVGPPVSINWKVS